MEKSTGGVSFDIRFIDSGNGSENYSSVESRRLIGIYDGDWSLEEDGAVNASMVFARRVGDIRSHDNLIEKVRGIGENMARVSISECLAGGGGGEGRGGGGVEGATRFLYIDKITRKDYYDTRHQSTYPRWR